jgi:hypothetical protein
MKKQQHMRIRSAARSATRVQEKALIEKAERLLKNPDLAFPECRGSCWFCQFKSGRSSLEKVRKAAEDEKKLERLAESGNDFSKAYAALMLLRKQGKVPYLFSVKTPFGDIAYAVRGTAKKERLIGMQQFDHPRARLISVMDLVRDKKLHLYSLQDKMVCAGKTPVPPREFVQYVMEQLKTSLEQYNGDYMCRHLKEAAGQKAGVAPLPHLEIDWKPAGTKIRLCEKCARPGENTLLSMLTWMAIPNPRKDFVFTARGGFECETGCNACRLPEVALGKETAEDYLHAKLDDKGLIDKQTMKGLAALKDSGTKIYILGKKCYGKDLNAFVKAMNPTEEEKIGLEAVLAHVKGPIVVEGETAGKMLETFWKDHGEDAMVAVCGDEEVATRLLNRYEDSKMSPNQLLKEAIACVRQKEIIAKLPVYAKLHPVARFADEMTRIHFTRGKEDTARAIERYTTDDPAVKSVAYAFLLVMGTQASKVWQYMKHEVEFADYLRPHVERLLGSTPDIYHANLQALLSATGSTEIIKEPGKKDS